MGHDGRESWGSWLQFLFSVIGSLVGLGNIWRFPYICYRNGGGAFLIPFCIFMCLCGFPIGLLQNMYSQYSSLGPGKVWIVCPLFKGIWVGMLVLTAVVSTYYTMLMAWILYYLSVSFSPELPWSTCDNEWNTPRCITHGFNNTDSVNNTTNGTDTIPSQEEYWINHVLDQSAAIDDMGSFRWELVLCLLASWVATFLCIVKGVQWMGKISYVTATIPYVILTILLIRGLLLPGSGDGLVYLFNPEWSRLKDYQVWRDAAIQLFYSAGFASGVNTTLASYNRFNNNCYRDAMLLLVMDTLTSLFASAVIFTYMGYMADISGKDMDTVIQQGPGLVFIAYPSALETLPLPQLWAVLFFLMLFCTGLDSQFCHIQALTSAILDAAPQYRSKRTYFITAVCVISFIVSLPMTTQGGIYVLNLIDWYIASISVMFLILAEMSILAWFYGVDRLYGNLEQMIGYRIPNIFGYAWKYVTPPIMLAIWLMGLVVFEPIGAKNTGYYPWCDGVGFIVAFMPILPIPILAGLTLYRMKGPWRDRIRESVRPDPSWGPAIKDMEMGESEKMCPDEHEVLDKHTTNV